MKVQQVICAAGRSGYMHRDLMAIKAGAKPNGYLFEGKPITPGFRKIAEAATIVSIMLVLEDGQIAFGDCADVILAGAAGRDPAFHAEDHIDYIQGEVAEALQGRDVSAFRAHAEEMEGFQHKGKPLHTAIRYGVSQALVHASALAGRLTMAEVIARDYGSTISKTSIPILASCQTDDPMQLDRVILKRPELLPHASFTVVKDHVGLRGEKLHAYALKVANRIKEIGDKDYHPRIHLDIYGTLGELFEMNLDRIADYIGTLSEAVSPFFFLLESPIIAKTQAAQVESYSKLGAMLRQKGIPVKLVLDEWCNTVEDVKLFTDAKSGDFLQIKTPDLGGIGNTIEAVLYCKANGMGASLGGTANETDQSARVTAHIGLACQPDFVMSKPGLGADEALMIQTNEMARTLAILQARR